MFRGRVGTLRYLAFLATVILFQLAVLAVR